MSDRCNVLLNDLKMYWSVSRNISLTSMETGEGGKERERDKTVLIFYLFTTFLVVIIVIVITSHVIEIVIALKG